MATVHNNKQGGDHSEALKRIILTKKRKETKGSNVTIVKSKRPISVEQYNRLAEIKVEIDTLSMEYSAIFDKLKNSKEGLLERAVTPYGILCLSEKVTWTVTNMIKVFLAIGKQKFLENCSIGKGGIENAIGVDGFDKLKNAKVVEISSKTKYYKLFKPRT